MILQQSEGSVGPPPLPGGVAAVLRFFFNLPQWIQITGFVLGLAVAAWLLVFLWRRRHDIRAWIATRRRGVKIALVAVAAFVILITTGSSAVSWNYMQHDNGFCTGCHIMEDPFQRFTGSKHDSLTCHACHQQSIFASMRQLYLWVADRPHEISMHAPVPNRICASCHVQDDKAKDQWRRIATTAGHRVHLESDSSTLRDLQCVTCHGAEVHRFVPASATCNQSGCHVNTEIRLGKMAVQTGLHCAACHRFTADVPLLATRDSAAGTLRPGARQCLSCHQMRAMLESFDPARDPHSETCGMCHNPHTQTRPADALKSCASAGCHSDWRAEPFHTGATHRRVAQQCALCHQPHAAKVDASDCTGCHAEVQNRSRGRVRPPQPFDTTRVLRTSLLDWPDMEEFRGKGDAHPPRDAPVPIPNRFLLPVALADTFPHDRHKQLACITCHTTTRDRTRLTFAPPRGCQICHHQQAASSNCAACHGSEDVGPGRSTNVAVAVGAGAARPRSVTFAHDTHARVACSTCHTQPVTLAPDSAVARCESCHTEHHAAARACAACHTGFDPRASHAEPVVAHERCDACHQLETVARLTPDRALCLTCHAPQRDHFADRQCTVCHLQSTPEEYRAHLRRSGA